ncbi:MAG: Gldg family protein [Myxococcota bacterium]
MELTTAREWVGRLSLAVAAVLLGLAPVVDAAVGIGGGVVTGFAAAALGLALVTWASETETPVAVRAGDLAATVVALAGLVVWWTVPADTLGLPAGWTLALGVTALLVGSIARASQTANAAVLAVAIAGGGLAGVAGLHGLITGLDTLGEVLLASAGGLLIGYAVLDRQQMGSAVSSRAFQYGGGAVLLTLLAASLAVGGFALAVRNDHTWELTAHQPFELSDQARRIGSELGFDVKVTAFFRGSAPEREAFRRRIARFEEVSPRMTVEWIDPLQEPRRAAAADITGDQGTVILDGNDHSQRLEAPITEADLVRALILLGSNEDHQVCWSLGHGEPDPDDEMSESGLGVVRLQLEGLNYQVRKLEVAKTGIPRDCRVVVIARPTTDWFPYEREALAAYVAEGGRALILVDPPISGTDVPDFTTELERFGVLVGDDVVVDLNTKNQLLGVNDPSFVVLSADNFGQHPILRDLGAALVMPLARSIRASKEPGAGLTVTELLHTSDQAWGETTPDAVDVAPDEGIEVIGEVPVMVAVEVTDPVGLRIAAPIAAGAPTDAPPAPAPDDGTAPAPTVRTPDLPEGATDAGRGVPADFAPKAGGRVVVVGDSDFAANRFVSWGNNRDLFLNTIAWLAAEEDQIGARPPEGDLLEISLGAGLLWGALVVVVIPGIAAATALVALLRRRNL